MHIIAACPFCQTSYQVQPTLRGQPIRCPNTACRRIFMIAPEPPALKNQQSGSVGDLVPILPAEQAAPQAGGGTASRHVSEVVPLAPAEEAAPVAEPQPADGDWWQGPPVRQTPPRPAATPSPPPAAPVMPAPSQAPWWGDAPPPVRAPQSRTEPAAQPPAQATPRRSRPPAESIATTPSKPAKEPAPRPVAQTQPMPSLVEKKPDQPRELPPGVWEPPPVRRGAGAASEQGAPAESEAAPVETHRPVVSKRRARWLTAVMILVPLVIIGGVGVLVGLAVQKSEAARFADAKAEYEQEHYGKAASMFRELAEKFPDSEHAEEYRFLQEWSALCSTAADPGDNLAGALEKLDRFIEGHKKDPLMVQYGHDGGRLLSRLTKAFAESNAAPADDKQPLAVVERIAQMRRTVEGLGPDALTKEQGTQIDSDLGKVRLAVRRWSERRDVLIQMRPHKKETPFDAVKRAVALLKQKERDIPGLGEDAEVRAALTRLEDAHLASVVYHPHEKGKREGPTRLEDEVPSRAFAPLLPSAAPGNAPLDDPIVLALARGVLYALKKSNGDLKWIMRVGIDTTVLPHRVPVRLGSPELLLVLSADTQTLTALNVEGRQVWEYHVGQPVLGRPVVIEQRAYLAAYDGWVHEIELAEGQPLGRYSLGQRLTRGGTREGDSKRIYFPADDSCIYVLDVDQNQRRCVNILYDGHPGGSLRSELIVVPPDRRDPAAGDAAGAPAEADETPGYLILNQANGLDAMSLRVFQLPLQDRRAAPLKLKSPARLNGWTWFEPYHDSEKVVALSDAGILGLFGIRQVGNLDQPLFPLLQPGGLDLSPFLHAGADALRERGRAQVVHVDGDDLWVLAHGRLQHLELLWKNAIGPQAVARWKNPPLLGSPLHAPLCIENRAGRSTFILVTQPLDQQTCIASAVDDEGRILWQRQLGVVFQGEPLTLTSPQGGSSMQLALDQGGGLFAFDPSQLDNARALWQSLAPALEENPRVPPRLLPAPDGHSAYEVAVPGDGMSLIVRHVEWATNERRLRFRQQQVSLLSPTGKKPLLPAGAPALVGTQLIVPMGEGDLMRVLLAAPERQDQRKSGPNWRSDKAAPNATCYVLALGGDRFLATDGSRGLTVWEWPAEGEWRGLPVGRGETTLQLSYPAAAPPVLLPAKGNRPPRVLLADSGGVLHLLTVARDGSLQKTRAWELKGRLTAAPFVRELPDGGLRVGCLLDERHLVWLDPEQEKTLWTYPTDGATIVGQPRLIEGMLVVALQSGHYLGLDPATGKPKGPGYTLRASAAPAASPVSFGPGRMLAPLSDGTALLLSSKLLLEPKP